MEGDEGAGEDAGLFGDPGALYEGK